MLEAIYYSNKSNALRSMVFVILQLIINRLSLTILAYCILHQYSQEGGGGSDTFKYQYLPLDLQTWPINC